MQLRDHDLSVRDESGNQRRLRCRDRRASANGEIVTLVLRLGASLCDLIASLMLRLEL